MNNKDLIVVDQFCRHHGIALTFISALQDYGMVEIIVIDEKQYFPMQELSTVEKIIRLYHELDINLEGIDVIMTLLERISDLQNQLLSVQNRLNFYNQN